MKIKYGIKCNCCNRIYHDLNDMPKYCKRCGATLWSEKWPQLGYHKYPECIRHPTYDLLICKFYKYDLTGFCNFVKIGAKFPYIYWKELNT